MTDLTVLVSPTPLYPVKPGFSFGRSKAPSRPIMVTLESDVDPLAEHPPPQADSQSPDPFLTQQPLRGRRSPAVDASLLSPPINTWKAPPPDQRRRARHRPTRSRSAPPGPERRVHQLEAAAAEREEKAKERPAELESLGFAPRPLGSRAPNRSFTSFTASTRGGPNAILPPPPPLLRPTTFWRKTPRSGVSGASYSPSSHLIRRSTYIAAGLEFDAPIHDLSALCVESRVGFIVVPPNYNLI